MLGVLCVFAATSLGWGRGLPTSSGIIYRVQSPSATAPSYLLGTIHSEDPRVLSLPDPVRAAFEASPAFALEVVPNSEAIIKSMVAMTYTDGRTLKEVLPADLYQRAAEALGGLGMTPAAFDDFKPWAVVTLLSLPPAEKGEFMDLVLYRSAVEAGKKIKGLETMEEQLAVFDSLTEADQIALLRETLDSRQEMPAMFEDLIRAYLAQDLDALMARSERYLQDGDPRLAALFREAAVDFRNRRMAERMQPLLDEGGWFIAVGALHLPGQGGVLRLLEQRGYEVRPLP
ncbi:MAG: TraB/GumN family protein [Bdellovibrio bacteriovorus]